MQHVIQLSFQFEFPSEKTLKLKDTKTIESKLNALKFVEPKMTESERTFYSSISDWHSAFQRVSDRQAFVINNIASRYLAS